MNLRGNKQWSFQETTEASKTAVRNGNKYLLKAMNRDAPIDAAVRAETKVRLQEALNSMGTVDREVLALRHFEQLSNAETAQELGIKEGAASARYVRALRKLEHILTSIPGHGGGTST